MDVEAFLLPILGKKLLTQAIRSKHRITTDGVSVTLYLNDTSLCIIHYSDGIPSGVGPYRAILKFKDKHGGYKLATDDYHANTSNVRRYLRQALNHQKQPILTPIQGQTNHPIHKAIQASKERRNYRFTIHTEPLLGIGRLPISVIIDDPYIKLLVGGHEIQTVDLKDDREEQTKKLLVYALRLMDTLNKTLRTLPDAKIDEELALRLFEEVP